MLKEHPLVPKARSLACHIVHILSLTAVDPSATHGQPRSADEGSGNGACSAMAQSTGRRDTSAEAPR